MEFVFYPYAIFPDNIKIATERENVLTIYQVVYMALHDHEDSCVIPVIHLFSSTVPPAFAKPFQSSLEIL